jgi:hypothetical protein
MVAHRIRLLAFCSERMSESEMSFEEGNETDPRHGRGVGRMEAEEHVASGPPKVQSQASFEGMRSPIDSATSHESFLVAKPSIRGRG